MKINNIMQPVGKVSHAMKHLFNFAISYTGLVYYKNLKLIPPAERKKGSKEKFYNVKDLYQQIHSIKLISSLFNKNFNEISEIAKKMPKNILYKMPFAFMENLDPEEFPDPRIREKFWTEYVNKNYV